MKACKVVSCEDIAVKNLFEKDKSSKSVSYDKEWKLYLSIPIYVNN